MILNSSIGKLRFLCIVLSVISIISWALLASDFTTSRQQSIQSDQMHYQDIAIEKQQLVSNYFQYLKNGVELIYQHPTFLHHFNTLSQSIHAIPKTYRQEVINYTISPEQEKPKLNLEQYYALQSSHYAEYYLQNHQWLDNIESKLYLSNIILLDANQNLIYLQHEYPLISNLLADDLSSISTFIKNTSDQLFSFDGEILKTTLRANNQTIGYALFIIDNNYLLSLLNTNSDHGFLSLEKADISSMTSITAQYIEFLGTMWSIIVHTPKASTYTAYTLEYVAYWKAIIGLMGLTSIIFISLYLNLRFKRTDHALAHHQSIVDTIAKDSVIYASDSKEESFLFKSKMQKFLRRCSEHLEAIYQSIQRSHQLTTETLNIARNTNHPKSKDNDTNKYALEAESIVTPPHLSSLTDEGEQHLSQALNIAKKANHNSIQLCTDIETLQDTVDILSLVTNEINEFSGSLTSSTKQTKKEIAQTIGTLSKKTTKAIETLQKQTTSIDEHSKDVTNTLHDIKRGINKAQISLREVGHFIKNYQNMFDNAPSKLKDRNMQLEHLSESSATLANYSNEVMKTINELADHIDKMNKEILKS